MDRLRVAGVERPRRMKLLLGLGDPETLNKALSGSNKSAGVLIWFVSALPRSSRASGSVTPGIASGGASETSIVVENQLLIPESLTPPI
jgi:hypothetical protein